MKSKIQKELLKKAQRRVSELYEAMPYRKEGNVLANLEELEHGIQIGVQATHIDNPIEEADVWISYGGQVFWPDLKLETYLGWSAGLDHRALNALLTIATERAKESNALQEKIKAEGTKKGIAL